MCDHSSIPDFRTTRLSVYDVKDMRDFCEKYEIHGLYFILARAGFYKLFCGLVFICILEYGQ